MQTYLYEYIYSVSIQFQITISSFVMGRIGCDSLSILFLLLVMLSFVGTSVCWRALSIRIRVLCLCLHLTGSGE